MEQSKTSQKVLQRFPNVQLRVREWTKSYMFFITYSKDGKQHHETLLSVPKRNKEAYKQAVEQCEELARKRDTELSKGVDGTMHIQARDKSFLEFAALVQSSKRTPEPYRKAILKLKAYLNEQGKTDLTFSELTPNLMFEFRDYLVRLAEREKSISYSTASKYFEKVKHIIQEALRRELLIRNPCLNVKPIPKDTLEREFLTIKELETLLSTPLPETKRYDARLYADYFLFICLTGIRPNDTREITWQNVQGESIAFIPSKTRTTSGKMLIVPLNREAVKILERQRERQINWSVGNRIFEGLPPRTSPNAVNAFIRNWLRKAGITKDISLYNARHTFASNLILSGAGVVEVSRLLGHTSLKHTSIYTHLTDGAKRDAVERLRLNAPNN